MSQETLTPIADQATDTAVPVEIATSNEGMPLVQQETPAESKRPCVIVMHASVGSGHRSAANAIVEAFKNAKLAGTAPEDLEVIIMDILDLGRVQFDGEKTASAFTGFTRPIYDLTWRYTFTGRLLWGGGTCISRVMFPRMNDIVREKDPIAIVCTHIMAANVAVGARLVTGKDYPIICVPTDYETEGLWPHLQADLFCVANEHMAETLRARKIEPYRIAITGIPTRAAFAISSDPVETRKKWNLPSDKRLVLAMAGSYMSTPYVHLREALDHLLPHMHAMPSLHLVLICGQDAEYKAAAEKRVQELGLTNVTVLGYVDGIASLMHASDLIICKSGGLTVTECLCTETPMLLVGRAYGQEHINVRMLTSLGAAMHATTAHELVETLRYIENTPESIQGLLINARQLRRPHAADDIVRHTFDTIERKKNKDYELKNTHFLHVYLGHRPAHVR